MSGEVEKFLNGFLAPNTDLTWRPRPGGYVSIGSGKTPMPSTLKAIRDITGPGPITIVPVISWGSTISPVRARMKTEIVSIIDTLVRSFRDKDIEVSRDIVKVNFTYRSGPGRDFDGKTGFFAGKVPKGKVFIADDRLASANTFRDLTRFLEVQGAEVLGVIETYSQHKATSVPVPASGYDKTRLHTILHAVTQGGGDIKVEDAVMSFVRMPAPERQKAIKELEAEGNAALAPLGLTIEQLTNSDVSRTHAMFTEYAADGCTPVIQKHAVCSAAELWKEIATRSGWKRKEVPAINTIKNPQALLDINLAVIQAIALGY